MGVKERRQQRANNERSSRPYFPRRFRALSHCFILALCAISFVTHNLPCLAQDDEGSLRKKVICVAPPNLRCSICHNASGQIDPSCALEVMRWTGKNNYAAAQEEVCRMRTTGQVSRNIGMTGAMFITGPLGGAGMAIGGAGMEFLSSGDACQAGKSLPFASLIDLPSTVCKAADSDADVYDRCLAGLSAAGSAFETLPFLNVCAKWLKPRPVTPAQSTFQCLGGSKTGLEPTHTADLPRKVGPGSVSIIRFPVDPTDVNSFVGHSGVLFWKDGKLHIAHLRANKEGMSWLEVIPFETNRRGQMVTILGEVGLSECQLADFWDEVKAIRNIGALPGYRRYDKARQIIKGCREDSFGNAAFYNCGAMTGEIIGRACTIGGTTPKFITR